MSGKTNRKTVLVMSVFLLGIAGFVQARTITVGHGAGYDFNTIQAAINATVDGDTVIVAEGTYYENININGRNIILTSTDPNDPDVVGNTIIDGRNGYDSVVKIINANVKIDGFTIQGGGFDTQYGGGIYCASGSDRTFEVIIFNNTIQNNTLGWGGKFGAGIYCDSHIEPVIVNNVVRNNTIENELIDVAGGGGIYCAGLDCNISGNVVTDNVVNIWYGQYAFHHACGGGIWIGSGVVSDNTVERNTVRATGHWGGHHVVMGGGIYCEDSAAITRNVVISNELYCQGGETESGLETSEAHGGGIYAPNSEITLNIVKGNTCHGDGGYVWQGWEDGANGVAYGGGIYAPSAVLTGNLVTNNDATAIGGDAGDPLYVYEPPCSSKGGDGIARGGGIYAPAARVINNTLARNQANGAGGEGHAWEDYGVPGEPEHGASISEGAGIYADSSTVISNTIVWDNSPDELSGHYCGNVTYCDIGDGACSGVNGNINADPLFVDANNEDFHLLLNSLCIDAGDNTAVPPDTADLDGDSNTSERIPLDLDGGPRFLDAVLMADTGVPDLPDYPDIVDMGAYETSGVRRNCFSIGEISPQTVWHGYSAEFVVYSVELGAEASFSLMADPEPVGALSLDSATGSFTYTPDPQDKESFDVTFTATKDVNTVSQTVQFEPMPRLPAEQTAFGLEPYWPVPDPESRDYIVRNEVLSETAENFNNEWRKTRRISISGKTVIFEIGHPNALFDYHNNDDIREMNIYAETVIIRSRLRLAQTKVTIYACELRFEGPGYINTGPRSETERPTGVSNDGAHGLKAGSITLHIKSFHSDPTRDTRFYMRGGKGQPAGLGQDGADGTDMSTVGNWHGCPNGNSTTYACRGLVAYEDDDVIYYKVIDEKGDDSRWPGDGTDAKPPGKPGNGGDGGDFRSNLSLSAYVSNSGGVAGEKARDYTGGRAGLPNPAYRYILRYTMFGECYGWRRLAKHRSTAGSNAPAPDADVPIGRTGTISQVGHALSWLHPYTLKMILAHAKDAYLYGHLDYTEEVLEEYLELLDTYSGLDEWNYLSDEWQLEFGQMRDEMQTLLHRIASNLDYFGNPAGWVPMLSFEVNRLAFENEIDHAIRVLYLAYWVNNAASGIQQKVNALETGREKLKEEIEDFKSRYNTVIELIPVLEVESINISNQVKSLQTQLQNLEERLLRRAQHNVEERHKVPFWKKALRVLGTICSVFPAGQPIAGSIGTGLDIISQVDSRSPWSTIADLAKLSKEFTKANFEDASKDWKTEIDKIDLKNIESDPNGIATYIKNLSNFSKPIAEGLKDVKKVLAETQVDNKEVEAELRKLKAADPEFNELVDDIAELMVRKKIFGRQLAAAMQAVSTLSNGITHNLLAIDGMNRDIAHGNAVLDPRAMMYLREMERRAKQRLLKYHYYMAKAYEYRMLRPYTGDLNLQDMFVKFEAIVADPCSWDEKLRPEDFEALKVIYEEQLSTIAEEIFDLYNANRPERSVPVRFYLLPDEIQKLNAGEPLVLNLMDIGLFLPSEENVRIVNLAVKEIDVHFEGGDFSRWAYLDLYMEHSGLSKLREDGEVYQFKHYSEKTENPITWGARYDGYDGTIDPIKPSAASNSLLWSLLDKFGEANNDSALLYSRPAAWADIVITKEVNTDNNIDMVIDRLRLEVTYDFVRRWPDQIGLDVLVSPAGFTPYFIVDNPDLNGRQDGRGDFHRVYFKDEAVAVEAPAKYGMWTFKKWTDRFGNDLDAQPVTDRLLQLNLSDDQAVRAQYGISGDFDTDRGVDMYDFAILALAWRSSPSDDNWNPACDVSEPKDNFIDILDLAVFANHWLAGVGD